MLFGDVLNRDCRLVGMVGIVVVVGEVGLS
jgi:hypothetical protein